MLDTYHMKILYHALVGSQLSYGILGWGGVRKTFLKSLESLQRRFLKLIYHRDQRYPSDLLYRDANVFDVRLCYARSLLKYQYKRRNITQKINHEQNTRLRANDCYSTIRSKKQIGKRYFAYTAPRLFNSIPCEIKVVNSRALFQRKIKGWLLSCDRNHIRDILDLD